MGILDTDRRVLALGFARMADSIGNSFLIVVLPLFVGSQQVPLDALIGSYALAGVTLDVTKPLLIGFALSLFGFLNSFTQPLTGRLSDRTGRRRAFVLGGLVLLGAASGALLFATNYLTVVVLRMVQGVGAACTIPATVALVNEVAAGDERGGNFGVFNTFRLIGFGLGPIVAGVVVETYSFDAAFAVAVAGAAVSFALVAAFVSDPERTDASAGDDLSVAVFDPEGRHLLDPVFTLGVATVCMAVGISLFATLQESINARLGQNPLLFGLEFGAVTLANVLFQIPVGRGSDRYGRKPFLVAGAVLLVPSTLAQGFVSAELVGAGLAAPAAMVLARFVQGVGVAMVFAPSLALAGDLAKEGGSGTTLSVLTMAFGLGVAVGPLASGYLVGGTFGFATPFVVGAALAVVTLVLVVTQVDETVDVEETSVVPGLGD
ncbi:MFS transporter [Candidatus Halobonum tyrrellensis]|uniref:Major facilitator superfamily transporter quinolone resistance protein n=1 Tax=Candidatus Halobonum tyrrellensis G22 TaxID=1324957 RepID=V4IWT8_9EURY|nr:MFS transporter [Candidatus Halobonum tyrrellensis]ESP87657.1 major facilitator superfamily transporter quinolone resistance protein [Candidatus Halobonum tyrrellensis G22]